ARGGFDDRNIESLPAATLIGEAGAAIFDAVGPLDDECQGRTRHRIRPIIAEQHRRMHGLAAPVDAALDIDERIDGAWRIAPGDTAIAQVEGRLGDVEKAI